MKYYFITKNIALIYIIIYINIKLSACIIFFLHYFIIGDPLPLGSVWDMGYWTDTCFVQHTINSTFVVDSRMDGRLLDSRIMVWNNQIWFKTVCELLNYILFFIFKTVQFRSFSSR